ncbi:MAG: sugar transferase [Paludibacteraceae bacterium]|nr:sugar transferase [Paludibacteraceae bacterium]
MYKHFFKRFFDLIISAIALLLIGWLLILITIFLHFANKGAGAFFLQERPGKDEKIFKIIKFKTMTDEKDAEGNLLPDKDRITKVGTVVRKLSIDELPQLINVFKGDMAFIGPRPLLPEYLPWYTEREHLRHTVRPGMSGWAQVIGRNTLSWDEKLALDVYYVEHLSLGMDCKIIARTIVNVLRHKDVNVVPGTRLGKLDDVRKQQKYQ